MKPFIEKRFNEFSKDAYYNYIKNHKKYSNFNTLALYWSIVETEKLSLKDKIEIRGLAHQFFWKSFEFLEVKDPLTYFKNTTIWEEITHGDEQAFWRNLNVKSRQNTY